MKVTEKGPSKWLSQFDLATPIVAVIADCRRQEVKGNFGVDMCDIVFFAGNAKPMILRAVTRKAIIAAYGDETDHWRGKPIEVYYDPTVQNSNGTGAIRVRIPAAAPQQATKFTPADRQQANAAATRPAAQNVSTPAAASKPAPPTKADDIRKALNNFQQLTDARVLEQWIEWSLGIPGLTQPEFEQLEDAGASARERLTRRQPATARR